MKTKNIRHSLRKVVCAFSFSRRFTARTLFSSLSYSWHWTFFNLNFFTFTQCFLKGSQSPEGRWKQLSSQKDAPVIKNGPHLPSRTSEPKGKVSSWHKIQNPADDFCYGRHTTTLVASHRLIHILQSSIGWERIRIYILRNRPSKAARTHDEVKNRCLKWRQVANFWRSLHLIESFLNVLLCFPLWSFKHSCLDMQLHAIPWSRHGVDSFIVCSQFSQVLSGSLRLWLHSIVCQSLLFLACQFSAAFISSRFEVSIKLLFNSLQSFALSPCDTHRYMYCI